MIPLKMASISGFNGPRGSLFHGSSTDTFGLGRRRPELGARSAQNWYQYAKSEVNQYDGYLTRARKIANKDAREQIVKDYYGNPTNPESGSYRRNSVAANIAEAESYTPINYVVYEQSRVQNRVEKLNDWNKDFGDAVKRAEDYYGSLPAPQIVESLVTVQQTPGWVAPVVVGALAVAGLAIFGVFGGK